MFVDILMIVGYWYIFGFVLIAGTSAQMPIGFRPLLYSNPIVMAVLSIITMFFIIYAVGLLYFCGWKLFLVGLIGGYILNKPVIFIAERSLIAVSVLASKLGKSGGQAL